MTALDWGIIAFTLALGLWGYRQGLIVGALTLGGFAVGAILGSRLAPQVLDQGAKNPYAPLFAAVGGLLIGSVVAVTLEEFALGIRRSIVRGPGMDTVDGAGGAILIGALALGLAWVFGAVALHAPGATQLRQDVQRSLILRNLNDILPPSGPILNALNRVDPAPQIAGPPTPVGPPNPDISSDTDVRSAGASVVRVLGTACGLGLEGSGWVVKPGLVVTNAHVVAGEDDTTVHSQFGSSATATPVYYDPRNDLALLRVSLSLPTLRRIEHPHRGAAAAVLGYPENGPYAVAAARFGDTSQVLSQDAYGRGPVERTISSLRADVRSGNSGGPVVDARGRVLGTVFAATTSGTPGGFAVPNAILARALGGDLGQTVDTGPCTA